MEKPLFEKGQKVVCVRRGRPFGIRFGRPNPLIEGKKYIIEDPYAEIEGGKVYVTIHGLEGGDFRQVYFMPEEADYEMENEIFESLKGAKILN